MDVPRNALYEAINSCKWDECRVLLERNDALMMVHYSLDSRRVYNCLYCCACKDTPIDIINAIHTKDPQLLRQENTYGSWNPFHLACKNGYEEMIKYMLNADPEIATIPNGNGSFPLHCLLTGQSITPSLVRIVLQAYPDAIHAKTYDDENPVHMFLKTDNNGRANDNNREILTLLLGAYLGRGDSDDENGEGNFPLHIACMMAATFS